MPLRGLRQCSPDEGYNLRTGAVVIRAEHGVTRALGDVISDCPQHRIVVVAACGNISKGHCVRLGCGTSRCPLKEGDRLRAGAVAIRGEMGSICAGCNAVAHSPEDGFLIVAALRNVFEHAGFWRFVCFHKDSLDGVTALDVLKGIGFYRADAPAVYPAIRNSIPLIRSYGEGLILAQPDADIAIRRDRAVRAGSCFPCAADSAVVSTFCAEQLGVWCAEIKQR